MERPMKILGIDTGKNIDLALLEIMGTGFGFYVVDAGTVDSLAALKLHPLWQAADLICIEEPAQILPSKRLERAGHRVAIGIGNRLLRTQGQARDIELLAVRAGAHCVRMTSSEARRAVGIRIGGRGATKGDIDRQTGILVPRMVSGWPKKSSNHRRDAAVVAIAGLGKWSMEKATGEAVRA